MQDLANSLILSQRCLPEPPERESGTRYKARSDPPLPFATVCTDLHRVAASGTSCTHPARWSKSASVLATAAFRPRATGHARRKRTLRWREADVRRGTGSGGLARGSLRRHRPPRLDRKSTRLNSSHTVISYAVFCL